MINEKDGLLRGIGIEVVEAAQTTAAHDKATMIGQIRAQKWTPYELSWTGRMATSILGFPPDMVTGLVDDLAKEPAASPIESARLQNSLDLCAMAGLDRVALTTLRDACFDIMGVPIPRSIRSRERLG